jgi:hypothetical protein
VADDDPIITQQEARMPATKEFVELKLASFRSEMRLLFVIAIAGNELISHVSLSPTIGAMVTGAAIGLAAAVKGLFL